MNPNGITDPEQILAHLERTLPQDVVNMVRMNEFNRRLQAPSQVSLEIQRQNNIFYLNTPTQRDIQLEATTVALLQSLLRGQQRQQELATIPEADEEDAIRTIREMNLGD